jgi:hypothetical protein
MAVTVLTACSPNFAGTYEGSVTTTYNCGSASPPSRTDTENYTLSESGGTVVVDANGCSGVPAKVSGNTADVQSYTCAAGTQNGFTGAVMITGGTLTLSGSALAVSVTGSTSVTDRTGGTAACDFSVAGTLNKTGD